MANKKKNTDKIEKKVVNEEKQEEIEKNTKNAQKDMFMEYMPYLIIIFFVVVIRIFIATPVAVSGSSMYPTLHNKDIMILYKLRKKMKGIERFDIVVIKTDSGRLIKRVIALPGEKINYKIEEDEKGKQKGILYINDKKVKEEFIFEDAKSKTCDFITDICGDGITVEEGSYYVMGDNRGNSRDSRMIGTIEEDSIVGITNLVIFPFNRMGNKE